MKKIKCLIGSLLVLGAINHANAQNKLYVDATATTGANNGSSWSNAYTSFAIAIRHADTATAIDSILVAKGTYKPEFVAGDQAADIHNTFLISRSNLAIIGGYANGGGIRNIQQNETIFSGNIGLATDSSDNANNIFYILGTETDTATNIKLDGVSITEGFCKSTVTPVINGSTAIVGSDWGSAIYAQFAKITLNNSKIYNHYTNNGAFLGFATDLNMENTSIHNIASDGNINSLACVFGKVNFNNCKIHDNIINNTFGAGLLISNSSSVIITDCIFENNSGGAVTTLGLELTTSSKLDRLIFRNNTNTRFPTLYTESCKNLTLTNSIIEGNNATDGILGLGADTLFIANNIIAFNTVPSNSIMRHIFGVSSLKLTNNTIVGNKGLFVFDTDNLNLTGLSSENNVIWGNTIFDPSNNVSLINSAFDNSKNSLIQSLTNTTNGNLNGVTTDPMFVRIDTTYALSDLRLQFCSPLINAGDSTGISNLLGNSDVLAQARYKNTIDIGAIEKQSDNNDYINNATLTQPANNDAILMATCEDNDWTYYSHSANPDSVVFAIKWGANSDTIKNAAKVQIKVSNSPTFKSNATNDTAQASIIRHWFVDLGTHTLTAPVGVRFLFTNTDTANINSTHISANRAILEPVKWIALDEQFNANTHLTYNNINNGNFETLTGSATAVNGIRYIQFDNVEKITSGTGIIKATKKPVGINDWETKNIGISVYPNPTTGQLTINISNDALLNTEATVYDIAGKAIQNVTLASITSLAVDHLAEGMYIIKFANGNSVKFTKL